MKQQMFNGQHSIFTMTQFSEGPTLSSLSIASPVLVVPLFFLRCFFMVATALL
jgi:hypothetical protein